MPSRSEETTYAYEICGIMMNNNCRLRGKDQVANGVNYHHGSIVQHFISNK